MVKINIILMMFNYLKISIDMKDCNKIIIKCLILCSNYQTIIKSLNKNFKNNIKKK